MLAEYFKVVGEVAVIAAGVDEVLEGGAADSYRLAHHLAGGGGEESCFSFSDFVRPSGGSYFGAPECFVYVNITKASDE